MSDSSQNPTDPADQQPPGSHASTSEPASTDPSSDQAMPRLPKIIPFRDLCRCGDEVWIEHEGQLYRLRCTKQGKLLLTK